MKTPTAQAQVSPMRPSHLFSSSATLPAPSFASDNMCSISACDMNLVVASRVGLEKPLGLSNARKRADPPGP